MDHFISNLKAKYQEGDILLRLLYINIGAFLLIRLADVLLMLFNYPFAPLLRYLEFPSAPMEFLLQPWSVLTYMFTHYDVLHILFNMLWLCWFGRMFLNYFDARKLFGVYRHRVLNRKVPLVRGFDDYFYIPHSRHTAVSAEAIHACPQLTVMAESKAAGVLLCMTEGGRQVFVMGHPEYDRYTLHNEYIRDKEKGLPIDLPVNYYPDDDCTKRPILSWRSHCNNLYTNWLNYYVYQTTPYDIREISDREAVFE